MIAALAAHENHRATRGVRDSFPCYVQPADLRHGNLRRVLAALLSRWPCSRPDLADRTGLSTMTVGKVAEQLLQLGLLEEILAEGSPCLGRKPPRGG